MQIIGFNFIKVSGEKFLNEKKSVSVQDRKITTNIEFTNVEKEKFDLLNEEVVRVNFSFTISYEPKVAEITFKGFLVLKLDKKEMTSLLKDWKDKKIPPEMNLVLLNLVLQKSTVKALQMEEELNLPPHFSLPKISKK